MSPRWAAYAFCLLGLPAYLWGLEGQRRIGALPADFAVHELEFPVRIEGMPAASPEHLRSLAERYPRGRLVQVESAGVTRIVRMAAAFPTVHHVISTITAMLFWMVCFFVFAERPQRDPGRVFFLSTFTYGLAIAVGTVAFPDDPRGPDALRPVVRSLSIALLPAFFVQMSLLFPRRRPVVDARPWILPALFVAAFALAAWRSAALLDYYTAPTYGRLRATVWPERFLDVFLVALVAAACVLMYQTARRVELTRERQQLKWLWWGITVGATPFVFLLTLPRMLGGREIVPLHLTRLFALAVPLSFAAAAVRHKLLDIDVIIRRSLIYSLLAGVLAAVYLLLAEWVGGWIAPMIPGAAQYVPVAAALVSVTLFRPTRRVLGGWVDRTFFHIRHSYGLALRHFRVAIAKPRGREDLARFLRRFAGRMLAPKTASVIVRFGSEVFTAGPADASLARRALALFEPKPEPEARVLAAPDATSMPEVEHADFPAELSKAGILLVQPMAVYGQLHGLILLGEKRSERRYIEEDLTFLAGVAAGGSAALERLDLAQRVAEERIVRERLDEINRMKSDFLSRVAHDLRTPVTAIDWSARNLLDGLAGPVQDAQTAYLQAILASAIHLNRLVTNLLEVSRLEEGSRTIELGPVGLPSVVDETVVSLAPIAAAKQVRLVPAIDSELAPVMANREKMVQVLVNLLENAIRYSPPGSVVEIALARCGADAQQLVIRDSGPGIRQGEEQAIFERFRQGAPSPHTQSQGFGLGLYVVKAYVEAFSGNVYAANRTQGGAEFVVRLRNWAGEMAATA